MVPYVILASAFLFTALLASIVVLEVTKSTSVSVTLPPTLAPTQPSPPPSIAAPTVSLPQTTPTVTPTAPTNNPTVGSTTTPTDPPTDPSRPNIVLFFADDLGVNHVDTPQGRANGLYTGHEAAVKTPQLYKMAEEGMFFIRNVASVSVCSPSRYALLSGISAGSKWSRIRGNRGDGTDHDFGTLGERSIAQELKTRGYATAMFGKYHFASPPSDHGFDYSLHMSRFSNKEFPRFFGEVIWEDSNDGNGNVERTDLTPKNNNLNVDTYAKEVTICTEQGERCDYIPDIYHNKSLEWVQTQINGGTPFFLYRSFLAPHDGRFSSQLGYTTLPVPLTNGPIEDYNDPRYDGYFDRLRMLASSITNYLDVYVGETLDFLKANNVDSNTIVIFTSDNGATDAIGGTELSKERILTRADGTLANKPYRNQKRALHYGGLAVPTLLWAPTRISPNSVLNVPTDTTDITRTILEYANVPNIPEQFNGLSLLSVIDGTETELNRDWIYQEICLDDLGVFGDHDDCDFAVTFVRGPYANYKVEWARKSDPDLTIRSHGSGFTSRDGGMTGNLTLAQLRINGYVPYVWQGIEEDINWAASGRINAFIQEIIEEAEQVVLSHRIVPTPAEIATKQT